MSEGLQWRKSKVSGSSGGNCVEIATQRGVIFIRDSKNPDGPKLKITPEVFGRFLRDAPEIH